MHPFGSLRNSGVCPVNNVGCFIFLTLKITQLIFFGIDMEGDKNINELRFNLKSFQRKVHFYCEVIKPKKSRVSNGKSDRPLTL